MDEIQRLRDMTTQNILDSLRILVERVENLENKTEELEFRLSCQTTYKEEGK